MRNITKIVAVLVSSLIAFGSANAGELGVSGSAKASYVINSGNSNSTGVGISNELNFTASGEMDNGYTWNYSMELDTNAAGNTDNDDTQLTLNTNGLGTIGFFDSEGGLSTELGYGIGALGVGNDYGNTWGAGNAAPSNGFDVSNYANLQYHLPADVLPFGMGVKVGFAPNTNSGDSNSYKDSGGVTTQGADGDTAAQIQVTAAPIDGLKVGADYIEYDNESGLQQQGKMGGNAYLQYAMGNIKVGVNKGYTEDGVGATYGAGDGTGFDRTTITSAGIEFAMNDAVSLSFNREKFDAKDIGQIAVGAKTATTKEVEMESDVYQVAYNVGGATVGLFHNKTDNSDFVAGQSEKKTILSLAMEF